MDIRNVIVVVIDRLGAGYLGPYGNTWVETPGFNRLASESVLFEHSIADTPAVEGAYRSWWLGTHAMCDASAAGVPELPRAAVEAGVLSTLLTDDSQLSRHPLAHGFTQVIHLTSSSAREPVARVEESQLGQFFAAAMEWLSGASSPFLLWLHARGMGGAWDAPRDFRERFADDEDPLPPDFVDPPDRALGSDLDADALWGATQAFAGQVLLLDTCLGALLDALEHFPFGKQTLLALTSPRGFPLGEHGYLGPCGDQLFGEVLHTPLLLRFPNRAGACQRVHALIQPGDLYCTLADWLGLARHRPDWGRSLSELVEGEVNWRRECACSLGAAERSIRTPAWFLRQGPGGRAELYAKPDDRWEVNEVAGRCQDVVEQLAAALDQFHQLAKAGRLADLPALPPSLLQRAD